ncbi:hypothetical protein SOASR031_06220 [Leminorella grimontii]|nr:hypothetical protein SOASR031_06220 [Leminorella grimontii]
MVSNDIFININVFIELTTGQATSARSRRKRALPSVRRMQANEGDSLAQTLFRRGILEKIGARAIEGDEFLAVGKPLMALTQKSECCRTLGGANLP